MCNVQILENPIFHPISSFCFHSDFCIKKSQKPLWSLGFYRRHLFRSASWLRYRSTVRFTFFRPLLRFPKKRSLPTPRGKISFFLRFDEPLSLRESGVLKSPYRNLKKRTHPFGYVRFWLRYRDSNPDKQSQRLLCYLYTISQYLACVSSLYIILHFENLSRGLIVNFQ